MDNERAINKYLKNFERQNSFETYGIDDDEKRIGREIVDLMKKKTSHTIRRMSVFNMLIT